MAMTDTDIVAALDALADDLATHWDTGDDWALLCARFAEPDPHTLIVAEVEPS